MLLNSHIFHLPHHLCNARPASRRTLSKQWRQEDRMLSRWLFQHLPILQLKVWGKSNSSQCIFSNSCKLYTQECFSYCFVFANERKVLSRGKSRNSERVESASVGNGRRAEIKFLHFSDKARLFVFYGWQIFGPYQSKCRPKKSKIKKSY